MQETLNVYGLPSVVSPEEMAGGTTVVIDVLRASTTIVHALEAGAGQVIPCQEIEDAQRAAVEFPRSEVVLGGEREGLPIDGFDLGNSPTEYTSERVAGKTIIFTTTNGTRAMSRCGHADRVLVGAFVNARAIIKQLVGARRIHLLCAGTRGEYGRDDILLAGLLVDRLQRAGGIDYRLNVQALTARENWTSSFAIPHALGAEPLDPELLAKELRKTTAGRNVTAIGREEDILTASWIDRFDIVPELDTESFRIRRSDSSQ
jgi:2-phosphosulfolactate phosphatase